MGGDVSDVVHEVLEAALRPVVNVISYEGVAGHTTFQLAVSSAPFRDLPLLRLLG